MLADHVLGDDGEHGQCVHDVVLVDRSHSFMRIGEYEVFIEKIQRPELSSDEL